jgi:hypothetical protein
VSKKTSPGDPIVEIVALDSLKEHPQNYRSHPEDQIEHIMESIRANGIYRNIVISSDNYILAGHGVTRGARAMGYESVPVKRLSWTHDSVQALKVLAGDNEISHLSENNDRTLTEILKRVKDEDGQGLLGTGYDAMMLQNLVFVTRPKHEIEDENAAAQWVGLPEYEPQETPLKAVISFRSEEDREEFARILEIEWLKIVGDTRTAWWPNKERNDTSSIRFEG